MNNKFNELVGQLNDARKNLLEFEVNFWDETTFKNFINDHFQSLLQNYVDVCVSGYFGEGFAKIICNEIKGLSTNVRLISPSLDIKGKDRRTLISLRKMQDAGVKIRINHRLHCRMFMCRRNAYKGLLVLGSFDLNREGFGAERIDAGIQTQNPDLVEQAYYYFNKIWGLKHDTLELNVIYPPE